MSEQGYHYVTDGNTGECHGKRNLSDGVDVK
jgi:hypothetical protein